MSKDRLINEAIAKPLFNKLRTKQLKWYKRITKKRYGNADEKYYTKNGFVDYIIESRHHLNDRDENVKEYLVRIDGYLSFGTLEELKQKCQEHFTANLNKVIDVLEQF